MTDLFNLLEKYREELKEDLDIDDFNLHDVQMKLPGTKHKWVARLMQLKQEKSNLKELRVTAIRKIVENLRQETIVAMSDRALFSKAGENEIISKIDNQLNCCSNLIDYLERVEKIFSQTTFDIKNLIEIKKLELT